MNQLVNVSSNFVILYTRVEAFHGDSSVDPTPRPKGGIPPCSQKFTGHNHFGVSPRINSLLPSSKSKQQTKRRVGGQGVKAPRTPKIQNESENKFQGRKIRISAD